MKNLRLPIIALGAGLLVAAPAFAQTTPGQKQRTDGNSLTTVGPGSSASKQRTDGDGPAMVGPGSGANKQRTDGEGLTMVGPGSGGSKQH
jgi:hypothetical protein